MATGHFFYTHADVGAPTLSGDPGSLIALIDFILDIGAPGAFWEKVFTGTNKAVYRATTGERWYLRVDDAADESAILNMYTSMSDVDTGVNQCPTPGHTTGYLRAPKKPRENPVPGANDTWVAFGDSRGFGIIGNFLLNSSGTSFQRQQGGLWFGELVPLDGLDGYVTALFGTAFASADVTSSYMNAMNWPIGGRASVGSVDPPNGVLSAGCFIASPDGAVISQPATPWHPCPRDNGSSSAGGRENFTKAPMFLAFPIWCFCEDTTTDDNTANQSDVYTRARVPYLYDTPYAFGQGLNDFDEVQNGADEYLALETNPSTSGSVTTGNTTLLLVRRSNNEPGRV